MKDFFTAYGQAAEQKLPEIIVSGRHPFQAPAIPLIVNDVIAKVRPRPEGRLLEIGCGTGLLLRPLASLVKEAVGIDHGSILQEFSRVEPLDNLKLLPGKFPDVKPQGKFDHIVVYSVLQYMMSVEEAKVFIDRCLELLAPGGSLLIADLPNGDAAKRFAASGDAAKTNEAYAAFRKTDRDENANAYDTWNKIDEDVVRPPSFIDDAFILDVVLELRLKGFEAYVLPQPDGLPFNMTREDLLVRSRR